MSKRLYILFVRGRTREFGFEVMVNPKHLELYREEGLRFEKPVNSAPQTIVDLGLARIWYWLQDKGVIGL